MSYINKEKFKERLEASPLFANFGEDGLFIRDFVLELLNEDSEVPRTIAPRLTKFNAQSQRYEYIESAKTHEEWVEQRAKVIQRLGEFEDKQEVIKYESD